MTLIKKAIFTLPGNNNYEEIYLYFINKTNKTYYLIIVEKEDGKSFLFNFVATLNLALDTYSKILRKEKVQLLKTGKNKEKVDYITQSDFYHKKVK